MSLDTLKQTTIGILAGGKGQRLMGRDKGLMIINGQTQIERLLAQLAWPKLAVMIACRRNGWVYQHYASQIVCDTWSNQGPVGGIVALLNMCSTNYLAVIPCDQAFIPANWLDHMDRLDAMTSAGLYAVDEDHHTPMSLISTRCYLQANDYYDRGGRSLLGLYQALGLTPLQCRGAGKDIDDIASLNTLIESPD